MTKTQNFEIIALDHPDYIERMNAIDEIEKFSILEEIFITDNYITVRMKAFDRLTDLYEGTNKYEKMVKNWKSVSDFVGWVHFIIPELGRGNNIEKTIRFILKKRGYKFEEFWKRLEMIKKDKLYKKSKNPYSGYRFYIEKTKNHIFQNIVDVTLSPIKPIIDDSYKESGNRWYKQYKHYGPYTYSSDNIIDKSTGIEIRDTDYGVQYHYEMVIKILCENENNELYHEYVYIRSWNAHPNTHKRFYEKMNYTKEA